MFARLKDADDNGAKGDDDDGDGVIVIFVYYPQHTAEYLKDVERISTLLYEQCKDRLHLQPENVTVLCMEYLICISFHVYRLSSKFVHRT